MGEADMQERPNGSVALVVTIVVVAIILTAANIAALILMVGATGAIDGADLAALAKIHLPALLYFIAAPLLAGLLTMFLVAQRSTRPATLAEIPKPVRPVPPSPNAALRLLGLLQQEARLVDFVTEDIDAYSDDQVGAAVRAIHAGCRKVLDEHVQLQRIFAAEDGSEVVVEKGFDPAAVRLTGNLTGEPPFHGTLQHGGWRATKISLPESPAVDPAVIAPAEVEIV
jgi:hypothetical protein